MKAAIIILSDPSSGTDESLGRLLNGLATAHEFREKGDDVKLLFQGPGTRWPEQLVKSDHPAHGLYMDLEGLVSGASCGCADVFGAREGLESAGVTLLRDYALPTTSGVASMRSLVEEGRSVLTF